MEKTIVIVMDEDKFNEQIEKIYTLRKTSIHVYNGDLILTIKQKPTRP